MKERACTVFTAPCRLAVYGNTKEERLAHNEKVLGKRFSSQSDAIIPKIREVDEFLAEYLSEISFDYIKETAIRLKCSRDDITDAICLAVVGNLKMMNKAETSPENPMKDRTGLYMQMVIPKRVKEA